MSKAIQLIERVLTPEECKEILDSEHYGNVENYSDYDEMSVDISDSIKSKIVDTVNKHLHKMKVLPSEVGDRYELDCVRIARIETIISTHYDPCHMHINWEHVYARHFVCVLYLTQFEMGELIFPQHGEIIKPNQGDMVVFPTGPFYKHQVNVSEGERWILRPNFNLVSYKDIPR